MILDVHGLVARRVPSDNRRSLHIAKAVADSPRQTDGLRAFARRRAEACARILTAHPLTVVNVHASGTIYLDWGSRRVPVGYVDIPA